MFALGGKAEREVVFSGLDQFPLRGSTNDFHFCIATGRPYALEFANDQDVVCLLLGEIRSDTKFEDDKEVPLRFEGNTAAFHPRGGNVRVAAHSVRNGFIAFSYGAKFQDSLDDRSLNASRKSGSRNNIRHQAIAGLAQFARERLKQTAPIDPSEMQFLAALVYIETVRELAAPPQRRASLSEREYAAIAAFIEAEMEGHITCAAIAQAVDLPLRVVFDGLKARTGQSPYQFLLQKRLDRARDLLAHTDRGIADVALACGFSSQQHLTATLSRKAGVTPAKLRRP